MSQENLDELADTAYRTGNHDKGLPGPGGRAAGILKASVGACLSVLFLALLLGCTSQRMSTDQQGDPQAKLEYIEAYQEGADLFNRARRTRSKQAFLRAAQQFRRAREIRPDSTGPILNEAFARLQAARLEGGEQGTQEMTEVIPILEAYIEKEGQPSKSAYTILAQLYRQNEQPEKAIDLTETAIEDLSNRPTHIRVSGTEGVDYTGTVEVGDSSWSVERTVPDRIELSTSEGMVSGSFQKLEGGRQQTEGRLQVALYMQGTELASDQTTSPAEPLDISADLSAQMPLAELQNQRLNALNSTGDTERAMKAYREQIEKNPDDATYRYNYGSLLLNTDRYDEAAEQLAKAAELDSDDPKKQYNLGAAYLNKAVALQDSLDAIEETTSQIDRVDERKQELDSVSVVYYREAIPPLKRAKRLSQEDGSYFQEACAALFQAYAQTNQREKATEVENCAGQNVSWKWRTVETFRGRTGTQTQPFTVNAPEWRIAWESEQTSAQMGANVFQVALKKPRDPSFSENVANVANLKSSQNTTYMYQKGRFYLDVSASNTTWVIRVQVPRE